MYVCVCVYVMCVYVCVYTYVIVVLSVYLQFDMPFGRYRLLHITHNITTVCVCV